MAILIKRIIPFFAIIILSGCITKFYIDGNGNTIPSKPNFKLVNAIKDYQGSFLIDTNAVYLTILTNIHQGPHIYDTLYKFRRFFGSGHYFASKSFQTMPSFEDYSNLSNGVIGYYTFKDGEIIIETYTRVHAGTYFYIANKLINEDVWYYKEKIRCWHCQWTRVNILYKKVEVENLQGSPYW